MTSGTVGEVLLPSGIREIRTTSRRKTRDGQTHINVVVRQQGVYHRMTGRGKDFQEAMLAISVTSKSRGLQKAPD